MIIYPAKDPDEVLDYLLDWSPRLGDDKIATSVWSFVQDGGAVKQSDANTDISATVWLRGGTNGASVVLLNSVTTLGGRTMEETIGLAVQSVEGGPEPAPDPAHHILDPDAFRTLFPAFAAQPTATLEQYWPAAVTYLGDYDTALLYGAGRQQALYLMMAHLIELGQMAQRGQSPGFVVMSRIDKISVQLAQPPARDAWSYWLMLTPYGVQLWALLSQRAAGGFYVGGLPERAAFRQVGGGFPRSRYW